MWVLLSALLGGLANEGHTLTVLLQITWQLNYPLKISLLFYCAYSSVMGAPTFETLALFTVYIFQTPMLHSLPVGMYVGMYELMSANRGHPL